MPNLQLRSVGLLVAVDNNGMPWGIKLPDGREIPLVWVNPTTGQPDANGTPVVTWVPVPPTRTSPGQRGQIAADAEYLYVCYATNTWARTDIIAW